MDSGFDLLKRAASEPERFVTYKQFCDHVSASAGQALSPGDHALPWVLGDVSARSHEDQGVMLTALVISQVDHAPGGGFYDLARDLHLLSATGDPDAFWVHHLVAVREAYREGG